VEVVEARIKETACGDVAAGFMLHNSGERVQLGAVERVHAALAKQEVERVVYGCDGDVECAVHDSNGEETKGFNVGDLHVVTQEHKGSSGGPTHCASTHVGALHVVSQEHDVEGSLVKGRGRGACPKLENEGRNGVDGDHVQFGSRGMEVEHLGPVGRKSLRQWKRRARSPKAGHDTKGTPKKVLGKQKGVTRLVGEGEFPKKCKNAQECVVAYASETDLAGPAVQPCQPK
jgi:hypothetical protein